ncbi:iron permease FTR1/Fip1/EfeU [Xylogone sp. PMI_703]|nr:iron permease FTR1/Fip1/EfeU [Xylogone sp. PMI_703]
MIIGGGLIGAFYGLGRDRWANTEDYWEGSFAIFASLVITVIGATLLRISKMQDKWRVKLAKALESKHSTTVTGASMSTKARFQLWIERYALFMLPFITVLREGLEAVVFVAGVSFSSPASAVPLPVFIGLIAGSVAGYIIVDYRSGATSALKFFLVVSTCLLYLVAGGLFSRGVWFFEAAAWAKAVGADIGESGSGPGSYDIDKSVWHINFGNPELNGGGGWGIFNAILGWQNSATYGSVISYNIYWIVVIVAFLVMRYRETKGHLPFMKAKKTYGNEQADIENDSTSSGVLEERVVARDSEKIVGAR